MFATTKAFLDHFNLKSLDELPALAELREMEPATVLDPDDAPVPAHLQALADASLAEGEQASEPKDETSFRSLLVELDAMEQGLKTDFADLRDEEPEVSVEQQSKPQL
jgi:segregation and condensation protein B